MRVCGIDPGKTGALAFMQSDPRSLVCVVPMPLDKTTSRGLMRTSVNWWAVTAAIREQDPDLVVIERQRAMPRQGVSSTFATGFQYGALTGILAALGKPYEVVEPSVWKRDVGLLKLDKDHSRERAIELVPEGTAFFARKKDHGNAEACLIALWKIAYADRRR